MPETDWGWWSLWRERQGPQQNGPRVRPGEACLPFVDSRGGGGALRRGSGGRVGAKAGQGGAGKEFWGPVRRGRRGRHGRPRLKGRKG